jgi:hypothetical protein
VPGKHLVIYRSPRTAALGVEQPGYNQDRCRSGQPPSVTIKSFIYQ